MHYLILAYLGFVVTTLIIEAVFDTEVGNTLAAIGIVLGTSLFVYTFYYLAY